MAKDDGLPAEACPVDPATRAAWLKANRSTPAFPGASIEAAQASKGNSCDSSQIEQAPANVPSQPAKGLFSGWFSATWDVESAAQTDSLPSTRSLGLDREISTIPRASPVDERENAKPANSEKESGVSKEGNWIYPSEKMFFDAMKRKGFSSEVADMKSIVPLHNAVNERTWKEILEWEKPYGASEQCGGPRLHSFVGLSQTPSPKARFNTMLGYTPPFDRHDWVVDRCGTRVDYIIDYYQGRSTAKDENGKINFYLDVRPKLNSLEGCKMRISKALGLV